MNITDEKKKEVFNLLVDSKEVSLTYSQAGAIVDHLVTDATCDEAVRNASTEMKQELSEDDIIKILELLAQDANLDS